MIIHGVRPDQICLENTRFFIGIFGPCKSNIFFFIFGFFGAKIFARITLVPKNLMANDIAVSVCGTYSLNQSIIDVWIKLFFGV
ncbi:MAG: hypothetical protein CM1200mP13_05270 [Candidatus Pelagibacterales bacterium]|nr:MAG: hypothetical protein CM1200mP13_05270 [Pelagibacterales bacterium]